MYARVAVCSSLSGTADGHPVCHDHQPAHQEASEPGQDHLRLLPQEVGVAKGMTCLGVVLLLISVQVCMCIMLHRERKKKKKMDIYISKYFYFLDL